MIDRETLRTARRTVERNGYTVLPPKEREEKDLNRFRTRREVEREDRSYRPAPRYRDMVEEEPSRRPASRFKPLRREFDSDFEERPVRSSRFDKQDRPVRREMNDDEKLGAAIRTAEENGFSIRKMTKLDQAKQVARDNGFEVRKIDDDSSNRLNRQVAPRTSAERSQRPLVRNRPNANVNDGIRTRTAPDTEIKKDVPEIKKNTYADDFMNRAAKFFGDNNDEE